MSMRSTVVTLILCAAFPAGAASLGLTYKSSTYIGGSFEDEIRAVTTDTSGTMYVAGGSVSSDLPTTAGTFQPSKRAGMDKANAFVAKVAPDGSLVWLTYLGGSFGDTAAGIAVDSLGNVFVTGQTQSADFPTTPNGFRPTCGAPAGSCTVGFLSELSPDGKALLWSSFIAGDAIVGVEPRAIALNQGLACVTGSATVPTLPVTPDAPQKALAGATDVFVSCFEPSKSGSASLAFSTFYGGSGSDDAYGIAADPTGRLFVAGRTDSNDFPVVNAGQPTFGGSVSDAFVLALSPTRSVAYATYFGGSNIDYAAAIAAAPDGSAYITGQTKSSDLPVRAALQPIIGGGPYYGETFGDAFVAKLDPTGALSFSTFLGGFTFDWGRAIAVGADGVVHVCGATNSFDFPTLPGAPDLLPRNQTAFATGLLPDGSGAVYSTLYRAIFDPFGCAFATDLVIGGGAHSGAVAIDHPVRPYTPAGPDGFVARLSPGAPGISDLEVSGAVEAGRGGTLGAVLTLTNHGPDTATGLLIRASNSPGAGFTGPGMLGSMLGISTLFEVADLPAGGSTAVPLVISPASSGPFDISFWTLAHEADPNSGNDSASFHASIAESHIAAAVAVSPAQSAQGKEVVAAIDVSNPGPDPANAVEVVVSPGGGRPGTAGFPSGCRIETPPLITCALGDVAVGAGAHVDLPIQLIKGGGPMSVAVEASSMSLQSPLDGHAVAAVDVAYADAVLGVSPSTGAVDAGQTASYALELRTTSGVYLAPWSVSCSAPGNGITCALDPASLDPGSGVARAVLSVSTAARTVSAGSVGRQSTLPAVFVLVFVAGMALASGTLRVPFALGRFAVGLFAAASIFACGCSSPAGSRLGPRGTPAGTYVVTVTATLGRVPDGFAYGVITRTTQVTLTVR